MSKQKTVYLMAGGRSSRGKGFDPTMQAILHEIGKKSPTIAYVGVASGDDRGFFKIIGKTIKESIECNLVMPLIADKKADIKKAKEILSSADAIFMSGGDVEAGMQILTEKSLGGFFKELFEEGKLFFGASAGAIMLAREWVRWPDPDDDATAELFLCMGIANLICDTHAESDDWEELKAVILLKSEMDVGYGIPTGSCLTVYPDNRVEALGGPVVRYIKKNGQVVKMPDLSPA